MNGSEILISSPETALQFNAKYIRKKGEKVAARKKREAGINTVDNDKDIEID